MRTTLFLAPADTTRVAEALEEIKHAVWTVEKEVETADITLDHRLEQLTTAVTEMVWGSPPASVDDRTSKPRTICFA